MFSLKGKFEFLEDWADIPFYNDVPKLSTFEWIILLISALLTIGYITVLPVPADYIPMACFLTSVIPALYICKGNYSLFFKRIKLKDIGLIILCLFGIIIYTIVVGIVLSELVGQMAEHVDSTVAPTVISVVATIFQIMGEEFFKIFLLLIGMRIVYRFTSNRKITLVIGLIFAMVVFGLAHYYAYNGMILQIIFIQGFGSIFEYISYLKTKNVWVSYLIHLARDMLPVILFILVGPTA